MRIIVCLVLVAAVTASPRFRRSEEEQPEEKADALTGYHHEVDHEHAKSHQSIKFHHFHPVPVYVKKEYSHLLKEPLEKGGSAHRLKQIHPKTEHQHSYGLVLENHGYEHGIHGRSDGDLNEHHAALEQGSEHETQGGEGESEGHEWGVAEAAPSYETKGFQEQQYQYIPVEHQQYSGYESAGEESY